MSMRSTVRPSGALFKLTLTALAAGALCGNALGEETGSAGSGSGFEGWWYYTGMLAHPGGVVSNPEEACKLNAYNHMRMKLESMVLVPEAAVPTYACIYRHGWFTDYIFPFTETYLSCESGFAARWPGVCVKRAEVPRPPSCDGGAEGWTVGNPVVVSSGAKLQTEVDLAGTPAGTLRIARHYRTLRNSGAGQSAGLSWSFSFDRTFKVTMAPDGSVPRQISGTMADGSYFEFSPRIDGSYASRFDKREAIAPVSADFHEWTFTSAEGQVDRFKRINDQFL